MKAADKIMKANTGKGRAWPRIDFTVNHRCKEAIKPHRLADRWATWPTEMGSVSACEFAMKFINDEAEQNCSPFKNRI